MSTLVNLEQIRATNALADAKQILDARGSNGDQLSGYHSLIITNGLLATLAYSADKKGESMLIAQALTRHLRYLQRKQLFPGDTLPEQLIDAIHAIAGTSTPALLAMMTDECMAYLNYLKRFVRALKN